MKKMNFKVMVLILLATTSAIKVVGQERVDRQKLNFNSTSDVITKAMGWSLNTTQGEWIEYENVISDDKNYKDKYKTLQGDYMMSRIDQNFINMKTKSLIYNNLDYYVLIVEKWKGYYEYPALKKNWHTFKQTFGYVFTKPEYMKLKKVEGDIMLKTNTTVYLGSQFEIYDETKFLDLIQTELSKKKDKYSAEDAFYITKSKEGAIRFYLPDYYSSSTKFNFDKKYFETDVENFSKIIIQ